MNNKNKIEKMINQSVNVQSIKSSLCQIRIFVTSSLICPSLQPTYTYTHVYKIFLQKNELLALLNQRQNGPPALFFICGCSNNDPYLITNYEELSSRN